jgi:FAD dependent oxidoreductase TIGR03364
MQQRADVAVIGAGIVGLAHAWSAARRGLSVVVFERNDRAYGASVRNFGMVWPIGQPAGDLHDVAMRSRGRWLELADAAGIWVNPCGSIHVAYRADEWAVLEEFASAAPALGYNCRLLTPREARKQSPAVREAGLLGGLWSGSELCVNPRQSIRTLAGWLAKTFGVAFHFNTAIRRVDAPTVESAAGRTWRAERIIVCSGADFESLFPEELAAAGLVRCKLQMLRTASQPANWRIGPHLAGGLTLRHYANFASCPSLPALKRRIAVETPELDRYGIHVMVAQNDRGELILGDSHLYDDPFEPVDRAEIDELIIRELRQIVDMPDWSVAERWHGVYAKHPAQPVFVAEPQPGVKIRTAAGGAGMTLSFGLADDLFKSWHEAVSPSTLTAVAR